MLGLVSLWSRLLSWLTFLGPTKHINPPMLKVKKLAHPEIPVSKDYSKNQSDSYWKNFPYKGLPSKPCTRVNTVAMERMLNDRKPFLRNSEIVRGEKALDF